MKKLLIHEWKKNKGLYYGYLSLLMIEEVILIIFKEQNSFTDSFNSLYYSLNLDGLKILLFMICIQYVIFQIIIFHHEKWRLYLTFHYTRFQLLVSKFIPSLVFYLFSIVTTYFFSNKDYYYINRFNTMHYNHINLIVFVSIIFYSGVLPVLLYVNYYFLSHHVKFNFIEKKADFILYPIVFMVSNAFLSYGFYNVFYDQIYVFYLIPYYLFISMLLFLYLVKQIKKFE